MIEFLTTMWNTWKRITRPIAEFQAQLIFAIFYVILLWPLGIVFRIFMDPSEIKKQTITQKKSMFTSLEYQQNTVEEIKRSF